MLCRKEWRAALICVESSTNLIISGSFPNLQHFFAFASKSCFTYLCIKYVLFWTSNFLSLGSWSLDVVSLSFGSICDSLDFSWFLSIPLCVAFFAMSCLCESVGENVSDRSSLADSNGLTLKFQRHSFPSKEIHDGSNPVFMNGENCCISKSTPRSNSQNNMRRHSKESQSHADRFGWSKYWLRHRRRFTIGRSAISAKVSENHTSAEFSRPKRKNHSFFSETIVKYALSTHEPDGAGLRLDFDDLVRRRRSASKKRILKSKFCEQLELQTSKPRPKQLKMMPIDNQTYPCMSGMVGKWFAASVYGNGPKQSFPWRRKWKKTTFPNSNESFLHIWVKKYIIQVTRIMKTIWFIVCAHLVVEIVGDEVVERENVVKNTQKCP